MSKDFKGILSGSGVIEGLTVSINGDLPTGKLDNPSAVKVHECSGIEQSLGKI